MSDEGHIPLALRSRHRDSGFGTVAQLMATYAPFLGHAADAIDEWFPFVLEELEHLMDGFETHVCPPQHLQAHATF